MVEIFPRVKHGSHDFQNFKPAGSYLLVGYVEDMIGGRLAVANSLWFSMNRLFFFPFCESCHRSNVGVCRLGLLKNIYYKSTTSSQVEIEMKRQWNRRFRTSTWRSSFSFPYDFVPA